MSRALVVTGYTRSDPTIAGLQAADYLNLIGYNVELFAVGEMSKVSSRWDKLASKGPHKSFIQALKKGFDVIIWTVPPDEDSLLRGRKATSRNYLLASWDQMPNALRDICEGFDAILCPSWAAYEHFKRNWNTKKAYYIPWDVSATCPLIDERERRPRDITKLFWPLYGWQAYRHEPEIYPAIDKFLKENHTVAITVGTSVNSKLKKRTALHKLSSTYPSRFQIFQHYDREEHTVELAKHDLCMWPTLFESYGFEGLTSLCAGVPIVAFDNKPYSEFLRNGGNSVVVKSELGQLTNGIPFVKPDYEKYFQQLVKLIEKPRDLMALRSCTHVDLDKRAALHHAGWERALK